MFFGKKQQLYMNQPPMVNMDMPDESNVMAGAPMPGMPYEEYNPELEYSHTEMGYVCPPYGCCGPYYEHTELEVDGPQPKVYVVQKGDTVYKIAKKFGLDWRELAGYNHLGNPDLIYPGERLFIPPRY